MRIFLLGLTLAIMFASSSDVAYAQELDAQGGSAHIVHGFNHLMNGWVR
ncbi:hypothetical protein J2X56_001171 [Herbaspirillum sp. 1173]|nr:hypothetical protein [Herbaspirillum sp. 1173]MDR6739185.1 hypothetical protein [Herbaspirillum sp. 1173]